MEVVMVEFEQKPQGKRQGPPGHTALALNDVSAKDAAVAMQDACRNAGFSVGDFCRGAPKGIPMRPCQDIDLDGRFRLPAYAALLLAETGGVYCV